MQTVPGSSVFMEWDTYAFTVTAAGSLLVTGAAILLVYTFRSSSSQLRRRTWWLAIHDGLLVVLVATTVVALCKRLSTIETATAGLVAATDGVYVDLWPACRMHAVCTLSITTLMAVALLKLTRPLWPGHGWPRQ